MAMTFSQVVQATLDSVETRAARTGCAAHGTPPAIIGQHARVILAADGSPDAPASLVGPVVEAVRDMLAAEQAGHGGA